MQAQSQTVNSRVLVVSGGGCRGAWGAGLAQWLTEKNGVYNVAFGTSTGSLMNPFILLNDFENLKKGYTTVNPKKIFDVNPFDDKGELRFWNALLRIIFRKNTLGETNHLRTLINEFLPDSSYRKLIDLKKQLAVGVVDLQTGEKTMKFSLPFEDSPGITEAKEMKDWIWASCNQPILMTYYPSKKHPNPNIKGFFVDGGLRETVPLSDALYYAARNDSITNIDVIINEPMRPVFFSEDDPITILKSLKRTTDIWRAEVINNDVLLATQDTCSGPDKIRVSIHYFPTKLYKNNKHDLLFDEDRMKEMWDQGAKGVVDDLAGGPLKTEFDVCRPKLNQYFIRLAAYTERARAIAEEKN